MKISSNKCSLSRIKIQWWVNIRISNRKRILIMLVFWFRNWIRLGWNMRKMKNMTMQKNNWLVFNRSENKLKLKSSKIYKINIFMKVNKLKTLIDKNLKNLHLCGSKSWLRLESKLQIRLNVKKKLTKFKCKSFKSTYNPQCQLSTSLQSIC